MPTYFWEIAFSISLIFNVLFVVLSKLMQYAHDKREEALQDLYQAMVNDWRSLASSHREDERKVKEAGKQSTHRQADTASRLMAMGFMGLAKAYDDAANDVEKYLIRGEARKDDGT